MNPTLDTQQEIHDLHSKIDKIYVSVEKTRKYFLWTAIVTLALFILPLIGLAFIAPSFLSNYTTNLQGAGL